MKMIISYEDDNCHSIGGHLHEDDNCRSIKQRAYHYQFRGGNVQFCDDDGIDDDDILQATVSRTTRVLFLVQGKSQIVDAGELSYCLIGQQWLIVSLDDARYTLIQTGTHRYTLIHTGARYTQGLAKTCTEGTLLLFKR